MKDGVLTTKDFMSQKNIIGATDNVVPIKKKNVKIDYKYKFEAAPLGKSKTTIKYGGKIMKLEMNDGVYEVPKNWPRADKEKFHNFILTLGFVDISTVEGKVKIKEKKEKPENVIYTIGHPDNTKDEKIEGVVSVKVDGKDKKFDCKKGVIKTEDEAVYKAFLKKGWYEISIKEKKSK